jgi:hypothetical protein
MPDQDRSPTEADILKTALQFRAESVTATDAERPTGKANAGTVLSRNLAVRPASSTMISARLVTPDDERLFGGIFKKQPAPPNIRVWFAKTLAAFEINDIAALPRLFCYNSDVERPVNYELRFIFSSFLSFSSRKQRGSRSRKL